MGNIAGAISGALPLVSHLFGGGQQQQQGTSPQQSAAPQQINYTPMPGMGQQQSQTQQSDPFATMGAGLAPGIAGGEGQFNPQHLMMLLQLLGGLGGQK